MAVVARDNRRSWEEDDDGGTGRSISVLDHDTGSRAARGSGIEAATVS